MDFNLKRAKHIRNFGISNLVFLMLFFATSIAVVCLTDSWLFSDYTDTDWIKNHTNIAFVSIIWFISLIGLSITCIGCFVCSILILATDWKDLKLVNDRILWGVLAFVITPGLSCLCFGSKAYKTLSNNTNNNTVSQQTEGNAQQAKPVNVDDGSW